jgi:hypothetical protein
MEQSFATTKGKSSTSSLGIWGTTPTMLQKYGDSSVVCKQAKDQGLSPIIAEGDSQIVINLLSHLLNGADPEKISPSWRLMNGLFRIKSILQPQWVILPSHVRRTTNQVVDMLENYGVDLQEGDFSCSPTSSSTHPTVIACRNIANNKDQPPDGVFSGSNVDRLRGGHLARRPATWSRLRCAPPHHHLMGLNPSSSFFRPHSRPACRTLMMLIFVGDFMVMGRTPPQSHHNLNNEAPKSEPGRAETHLLLRPLHFQLSMVFNFFFSSWCDLHSASWTSSSCFSLTGFEPLGLVHFLALSLRFPPRLPVANSMPRLRGKSKRGAAWYAARGRVAPNSGSPPETDGIPILNPIEAPTPAQPFRETTPDLSPLSNPYACRIEWFDNFDNSLGFAPPPPSPPRRPPPPPSPPRHPPPPPPVTSSAPSVCPSSSSDSPLSPPLPSTCDRCADRATLMDSLDDLKRGLGDVKSALLELQIKESERWSRVDLMMSFLQDLRQAISDRDRLDRGKLQVRQAFAGPRFDPGFS